MVLKALHFADVSKMLFFSVVAPGTEMNASVAGHDCARIGHMVEDASEDAAETWRGEMMDEMKAVYDCLLGKKEREPGCENCESCGWNPKIAKQRKQDIRRGVILESERIRLTIARKTAYPDKYGWYSVKRALPDDGERVIVTDGVFVGEAFLGKSGTWKRYGIDISDGTLGIFPPVAWRPMPEFIRERLDEKS